MARCCNSGCRRRGGSRASSVAWRVSCPTFAELAEHRTQVWSSGAARLSRFARVLIAAPWKRASLGPKASRSDLFERWPPITILICWDNNTIECAQPRCSARSRRIRPSAATRAVAMQRVLIDPAESARTRTRGDRSGASGTPGTRMAGSSVAVASARQWTLCRLQQRSRRGRPRSPHRDCLARPSNRY
jgi:hypothetical protein